MAAQPETRSAERAALIAEAAEAHAKYPQYDGYWDGWLVGSILRDIKIRGQLAFTKGERVLFDPASFETLGSDSRYPGRVVLTAYRRSGYGGPTDRMGVNTSIRANEIKIDG